MNLCVLMGRLTRDPEVRRTGGDRVFCKFGIAVDRDFAPKGQEKKTDFFNCTAWGKTGEFVGKYFTKGRMILVIGRIQIGEWTDQEGNRRTAPEIVVDNAKFTGEKRADTAPAADPNPYAAAYAAAGVGQAAYSQPIYPVTPDGSDFAILEDDDGQLPF